MGDKQSENMEVCPGCGTRFKCGAAAGLSVCWCMEKPSGLFVPEGGGKCYCPECLEKCLSEQSFPAA